MKITPFDPDKHYNYLVSVWHHFGWMPCPKSFLPKNGFVALSDKDDFIAALFMYCDPGSVALIDWAVGSTTVEKDEKDKAFQRLFNILLKIALANNCTFIYSVTAIEAFQNKLTSWGLVPVEKNMKSFVMPLKGGSIDFLKD